MLSGKIKGTLRIVTALKKATTSDSPKMKKQEIETKKNGI